MLTVGHSNRPLGEFCNILKAHGVRLLVDVRTVPRSRHNPQFNQDVLPPSLAAEAIRYEHLPGLGGLRHARKDSPNTGWKNLSFRGYADYMQTPDFTRNLETLLDMATGTVAAMMCAEAVPWRCHRSMIGDALLVRGVAVIHILSASKTQAHKLTPFALVQGTGITYPSENLHIFNS